MRFVGRQEELRRLRRIGKAPEGGLVVVWGRRRIGKTRLLLEWLREGAGLYGVAEASAAPIQRRYFAETVGARLPGFGEVEYPDWTSLLTRMAREAREIGWRGPVVLDELPYLVESASELPSVLQRFVDHEAREAGLILALAGSSQRMMQGLVLSANAPLYGRAREILKLEPIAVGYLGDALGIRDAVRVVEAYACWGGVPRYWELAEPFRNLRDAADALVLDPLGPLHDEPARLLLEETPPATALRPVLDAIGAGAHRVSEIAGRLGCPATSLARPLARLQELELVTREIPFGEPERSGKRALYKLADPFLRLWFTLVAPHRAFLMQATSTARLERFDALFPRLRSAAWEELCRRAVPRLERVGPARRFWLGTGPEWDVVAGGEDHKVLLLGESKWTERTPSVAALDREVREMLAKGVPPVSRRQDAEVRHVLFIPRLPRRGLRPSPAGVRLIDAATVVSALR